MKPEGPDRSFRVALPNESQLAGHKADKHVRTQECQLVCREAFGRLSVVVPAEGSPFRPATILRFGRRISVARIPRSCGKRHTRLASEESLRRPNRRSHDMLGPSALRTVEVQRLCG